ncbi:MAG: hypothetical protein ACP5IB_10405, partial [Thermoplasmata archaeon]
GFAQGNFTFKYLIIQQVAVENNIIKELKNGLSLIPKNSSVFMQSNSGWAMNFEKIYTSFKYHNETVDYAIIDPGTSIKSSLSNGYSSYWANRFAHNLSYGIYESIRGIIINRYIWMSFLGSGTKLFNLIL